MKKANKVLHRLKEKIICFCMHQTGQLMANT